MQAKNLNRRGYLDGNKEERETQVGRNPGREVGVSGAVSTNRRRRLGPGEALWPHSGGRTRTDVGHLSVKLW